MYFHLLLSTDVQSQEGVWPCTKLAASLFSCAIKAFHLSASICWNLIYIQTLSFLSVNDVYTTVIQKLL